MGRRRFPPTATNLRSHLKLSDRANSPTMQATDSYNSPRRSHQSRLRITSADHSVGSNTVLLALVHYVRIWHAVRDKSPPSGCWRLCTEGLRLGSEGWRLEIGRASCRERV